MNIKHIHYLEHDASLANLVKKKLESLGYLVDVSVDGLSCLEQVKQVLYDVLIVDYSAVIIDEWAVLQSMFELDDKMPVIMVSESDDVNNVIESMKLGCVDYVVKEEGCYVELLANSIKDVLAKSPLKEQSEKKLTSRLGGLQRAQTIAKIGNWEYHPGDEAAKWSDQEYRNFGYKPNEVVPTYERYIKAVHPDDRDIVEKNNESCLADCKTRKFDYRLLLGNGEVRCLRTTIEVDVDGDSIIRIFGVSQDITQQKKEEVKFKQASTVLESSTEAIFITDEKNIIISVNPAFTEITGFSSQQAIGQKPSILASDIHDAQFFKVFWRELIDNGMWQGEMWNRHRAGHIFPTWQSIAVIRDGEGKIIQYVAMLSDISKMKESEALMHHQASYDALTDLPNRYLFIDYLSNAIKQANRSRKLVALMLLDLDHFKWVNDTMGHKAGDILLQETAKRLQKVVRNSDMVARIGGDEFTIILSELERSEDAETVAEKIFTAFVPPVDIEGCEVFISASVGISIYPDDGKNAETLQDNADSAMYSAKENGRNCFHYFTPLLQVQADRRLMLINYLRQAVENDELLVYYQPIKDVFNDCVVGAEALIRWNQSTIGFVSPDEFIPLAEETGLIKSIGDWVVRKVASDMQRWQEQGLPPLSVSINKSPAQFSKEDSPQEWKNIFTEHNVPMSLVTVEITETVFMEAGRNYIEMLKQMQAEGIKISWDDFGTGYSSLSCLKQFPVDSLKIDCGFVGNVTTNPSDALLVETIIALAEKMNIKVIAEGVETEQQMAFLIKNNCRFMQGYYFSQPLPRDEFERYIKAC